MSLSGNIQDVSVADTLQFIHLGGRTGTLTAKIQRLATVPMKRSET